MLAISPLKKGFGFHLKIIIILLVATGTYLSVCAMGGIRAFMYFTIQSNITIGAISIIDCCLTGNNLRKNLIWFVIKLVGIVSITLTGFVFLTVLSPTYGRRIWNIRNILIHIAVPILAIIVFVLEGSPCIIKKRNVVYVFIPPVLYVLYAWIGYINCWEFAEGINYPYLFLNWGSPAGTFGFADTPPYIGSAWWILGLFIFVLIEGLIYICLLNRKYKKTARRLNGK